MAGRRHKKGKKSVKINAPDSKNTKTNKHQQQFNVVRYRAPIPIHRPMMVPMPPRKVTSSQKHQNFIGEPMIDKPVTELIGVGPVLGQRLVSKGYDKAYTVFGQYLLLKKNKTLFTEWLKDEVNANARQALDCWECLTEWSEQFL